MYIIILTSGEVYWSDNIPDDKGDIQHMFDLEAKKEYIDGVWLEIDEWPFED